jgi:ABC-type enterochelin transport system substrate-binding protein
VNIEGKRLRECVFSGHKIVWNYWKKDAPIVKITIREERRLEQIKQTVEKLKKLFPDKFNDEALQRKAKEIEEIFYEVIRNGRMEKASKTQNIRNENGNQAIPKPDEAS